MRVVRTAPDGNGEHEAALTGHAVDLAPTDLSPETLRNAIRGALDHPVSVACPEPSRWWDSLALPTDDTAPLDRLVAAGRSRGIRVPEERALAAAERKLATLSPERVDLAELRRQLAAAGETVTELREEVATARGRLQARRRTGADTAAAETALADAAERLSEAETERLAAEQAHEAAERRARRARSVREQRLRLQDRVANRRRDARRALITELTGAFDAAVADLPGAVTLSTDPLRVDGDPVTAALAAARLADLRAPVIDTTDRFDSATAAAETIGAPVIRC
jgi:hypothetical protein